MFRNPYADALVALLIVLLIFGPKRLPTLGRSLGQGLREFKDSITGGSSDSESEEGERPEIARTSVPMAESSVPEADPAPAATPAPGPAEAGSERRA